MGVKPVVKTNRQYCWDILLSQQILDAMKHGIDGNFIFLLMLIVFNSANTHLPFFLGYDPKTVQSLTPMTTKFREPQLVQ